MLVDDGWPAGWAATPIEKPPMARASATSSMAWRSSPAECDGIQRLVAAEGHQVLDPRPAVAHENLGQFEAAVGDADQMGHRGERSRVEDAGHQVERAPTRLAPAPIGHGHERRGQRLEPRSERDRRFNSASFFGGKNSNEYVGPFASRSAMRVTTPERTARPARWSWAGARAGVGQARPKSSSRRTMSSSPK